LLQSKRFARDFAGENKRFNREKKEKQRLAKELNQKKQALAAANLRKAGKSGRRKNRR